MTTKEFVANVFIVWEMAYKELEISNDRSNFSTFASGISSTLAILENKLQMSREQQKEIALEMLRTYEGVYER